MSKAGISFEEMKSDMLKDEEFEIEYEKLQPRYEAIEQIIRAREVGCLQGRRIFQTQLSDAYMNSETVDAGTGSEPSQTR